MTNDELQGWVRDELFWDPKVDSAPIVVSANDGEVTLRGTVGSFREKREAQKAAERVYGVTSVNNRLQVRMLDEYGRQDADLRGAVLQAMGWTACSPRRSMPGPTTAWSRSPARRRGSTSARRPSSSPGTCPAWSTSTTRSP
jgi:hypothetical protein